MAVTSMSMLETARRRYLGRWRRWQAGILPPATLLLAANTSGVRQSLACLSMEIFEALVDVHVFAHAAARIYEG